ncbi:hypothetical protein [Winogradskyella vincentii]|uniref:Uncharacterized protein n=1 Tax=Winogradskyella vincentii TaxID=2877122 RepID=A0ABS7Y2V7_9FLAO|nr:hypothetical protein [Winogradskyella vincentii]MCA0154261.1 hypothetical protein [Winogradskyella vincentii]
MRFCYIFITLLFLLGVVKIQAQSLNSQIDFSKPKPVTTWGMVKYDTKYTFKSVIHAFTKPLSWKEKDFTKFIILIGGTAGITSVDEPIRRFAQNQIGLIGTF